MTDIVLLHHAQGLTTGIRAFADRLAAAGHHVTVPDLYDAAVVYVGFSLGVLPAQMLAQTRPGALGAVLVSSAIPPSEFGGGWPDGVPLQLHAKEADALMLAEGDMAAARELASTVPGAELHLYPGDVHLFAGSSLAAYDAAATDLLVARMLELLG